MTIHNRPHFHLWVRAGTGLAKFLRHSVQGGKALRAGDFR